MKVLVVGTGGALGGSGITTMADQMTRTLTEMGHDPTRLVAGARRREHPNRLNLENSLAVFTEAVTIARAARSRRSDVVWLHTFGIPTLPAIRTLVQVIAVRAVRRPVVVQLHAFALADRVETAGWILRSVLRTIGHLSRRLVVLQEADASPLRRILEPAQVAILANWVEVPDQPAPLPKGPPYRAVFVGGLVTRKGVPQLIEAMRLLDDLPIVLTIVGGPGDEGPSAAAAIERAGEDLVCSGTLRFAGQLDATGVRAELRAAHLFVLPSEAEGMPLAMLEAMAEGRPVVVSDAGNMASVVRGAACGFVLASTRAPDIADALRIALCDHKKFAALGAHAHRVALERYSVGAATGRMNEILEERL